MPKWLAMETKLEDTLESLNSENYNEIWLRLWSVNLIWCQDLLIKFLLSYSSQFHLPVGIVARLTLDLYRYMPEFGESLVKQIILNIIECINEKRSFEMDPFLLYLAELFKIGMVDEIIVLQILSKLSADEMGNLHFLLILLQNCGMKLKQTNPTVHDAIYQQIIVLQVEDTNLLNELDQWKTLCDSNYADMEIILSHKVTPVSFLIDDEWKEPNANLGDFEERNDIDGIEVQYEILKQKVLNDTMKKDTVTEEEEKEENNDEEEKIDQPSSPKPVPDRNLVKDMTNSADIEFKKKIYLLLKSSLSGDEAAHKILKLRIPDNDKFKIVDIIIRSSIQESTYSKFYGIIGERLLNSHRSWKPAFEKIFNEIYEKLDEFEPSELRIIGKIWGHLLATDYLGLEIFQIIKLNESESTPPGRILIKFIFQELVADLNIDELKKRLNEPYIKPFLKGMFPNDNVENLRYSINYFTAIGLGVLTEEMRSKLEIMEQEEEEDDDEDEEVEEEEEDKIEETAEEEQVEKQVIQDEFNDQETKRTQKINPFLNSTTTAKPSRYERERSSPRNRFKRERSISPPRRIRRQEQNNDRYNSNRYDRRPQNNSRYDNSNSPPERLRNNDRFNRNRYDNRFVDSKKYERSRSPPPRGRRNDNALGDPRTTRYSNRTKEDNNHNSTREQEEVPPHLKGPPRYNNRYKSK